ncbi:MAG: SDR family NAD(P)-dependent oxidoreductase, partial [Actinomycetota bacterium]
MSSPPTGLTVVVTGANRGIGLEVTRQLAELGHTVLLGSRSSTRGAEAARSLAGLDGTVRPLRLDVADQVSIADAASEVEAAIGRVDVVINNAAIHYDTANLATAPDLDLVREAMETNVYGAWHVVLAFLPLLRRSSHGRIVNVSSGAGALSEMGGSLPAYRLSKVSLNALTRMWAAELGGDRILVNAVCPGWVATDMGGAGGRPVSDG